MYNLINLLHRFGRKYTSDDHVNTMANGNNSNDGVVLSVGAIVKLYKYRLGGDLSSHVRALGYPTIVSYLKAAFGDESDDSGNAGANIAATENLNGVSLVRIGHKRELALSSSLSMKLARESASRAEFVQFAASKNSNTDEEEMDGDGDGEMESDNINAHSHHSHSHGNQGDSKNWMVHTGTTFQISSPEQKYQTITVDLDGESDHPSSSATNIQPLSAAVRISQDELFNLNRQLSNDNGTSECNAFVHSYDLKGDNGSPLLICTIDPPKTQIRNQMKRRAYVMRKKQRQVQKQQEMSLGADSDTSAAMESSVRAVRDLKDLNAGEGPFRAKIVHISPRSGAAFVDIGVYRLRGKKHGGGKAQVLGMLRFDDVMVDDKSGSGGDSDGGEVDIIKASIQEGEGEMEQEEDVSDFYSIDDDGNISMIDPNSQEMTVLGSIDDESGDDDYDHDDDDDDNMFAGMTPEERLSAIGDLLAKEERSQSEEKKHDNNNNNDAKESLLEVGNEVDVYVRAVFPQSGRFMVSDN